MCASVCACTRVYAWRGNASYVGAWLGLCLAVMIPFSQSSFSVSLWIWEYFSHIFPAIVIKCGTTWTICFYTCSLHEEEWNSLFCWGVYLQGTGLFISLLLLECDSLIYCVLYGMFLASTFLLLLKATWNTVLKLCMSYILASHNHIWFSVMAGISYSY